MSRQGSAASAASRLASWPAPPASPQRVPFFCTMRSMPPHPALPSSCHLTSWGTRKRGKGPACRARKAWPSAPSAVSCTHGARQRPGRRQCTNTPGTAGSRLESGMHAEVCTSSASAAVRPTQCAKGMAATPRRFQPRAHTTGTCECLTPMAKNGTSLGHARGQ